MFTVKPAHVYKRVAAYKGVHCVYCQTSPCIQDSGHLQGGSLCLLSNQPAYTIEWLPTRRFTVFTVKPAHIYNRVAAYKEVHCVYCQTSPRIQDSGHLQGGSLCLLSNQPMYTREWPPTRGLTVFTVKPAHVYKTVVIYKEVCCIYCQTSPHIQ